jgi:excisionase family DNA binding protein
VTLDRRLADPLTVWPELLTYEEAGELLGRISRRSVERLAVEGKLRVLYVTPRNPRIERREIDAYLASIRKAAA